MADRSIDERLAAIEAKLDDIAIRLGRQVAVTEALRSDMRLLNGLTRSIFTTLQALAGGYADLSSRIADLENPAQ